MSKWSAAGLLFASSCSSGRWFWRWREFRRIFFKALKLARTRSSGRYPPDQPLAKPKHDSVSSLPAKKMQCKDSVLVPRRKHHSPSFFRFSLKIRCNPKCLRSRKQRSQATAPNLQNANPSKFCSLQRQTILSRRKLGICLPFSLEKDKVLAFFNRLRGHSSVGRASRSQ